MREIWAADSETDPFAPGRTDIQAFVWGATNGDEYHEFKTVAKFVEFFIDKKVIVYMHNGGKFDYHLGVFDYLEPFTELTVIAGRVAKFKIGQCEFRDSINILPVALAAGGEKLDIDYSKLERENREQHAEEISAYLKQDCFALYELVRAFIDEYGLNLTVAGTAIKEWKKISGIKPPASSAEFYSYFAPYYYGGRVEAYHIGVINEPFAVVDINSAYPHAMLSNHPLGTDYTRQDELPDSDADIGPTMIKLSCAGNGAFPFRANGPLTFPRDNVIREFTVTGWEYLAARDCGVLGPHHIKWVHVFDELVNFDEYVYQFYNMKNEAKRTDDKARYLFAKLLLNSLYGKFGSNPEKYSEYRVLPQAYVQPAINNGYKYEGDLDGNNAVVSEPLDESKRRYYNVATAASITGCVRAFLFRHLHAVGDSVLYCDTDSIAYRTDGDTGMFSIGKNIGQWEVEAVCDEGAIAGKKLYAFHTGNGQYKTASKGVKLSPDEIYRVARGETVAYTRLAPTFSMKKEPYIISRDIKRAK